MKIRLIFWIVLSNFLDNFKKKKLISAHRGSRSKRAENTMSAFELSLNRADFFEFDVCLTKDKIAVVIHDDTLNRTSDIEDIKKCKELYKVTDFTYDEIKKLDFSSWFIRKDPFKTIKNNIIKKKELEKLPIQRISTLKEVLEFVKKNNFPANVELKDMKDTQFDKIMVKEVVKIIKETKVEKLVLLSSFNHSYMNELNTLAPNLTKAVLQKDKNLKDIIKYLQKLKVDAYHCHLDIVDANIIKLLNDNNFFVNVYTVNDTKEQKKLFNMGVKGIFSDYT
jgi:glycerophosphoryl diester phosphodiesterase